MVRDFLLRRNYHYSDEFCYSFGDAIVSNTSTCHFTNSVLNCFTVNPSVVGTSVHMSSIDIFSMTTRDVSVTLKSLIGKEIEKVITEYVALELFEFDKFPLKSFVFDESAFIFFESSSDIHFTRVIEFRNTGNVWILYGTYDINVHFTGLVFGIGSATVGPVYLWERINYEPTLGWKPLLRISSCSRMVEFRAILPSTVDIRWNSVTKHPCTAIDEVQAVMIDDAVVVHKVSAESIMCSSYEEYKPKPYHPCYVEKSSSTNSEYFFKHKYKYVNASAAGDYMQDAGKNIFKNKAHVDSRLSLHSFKDNLVLFCAMNEDFFDKFYEMQAEDQEVFIWVKSWKELSQEVQSRNSSEYVYKEIKFQSVKMSFFPLVELEGPGGAFLSASIANTCMLHSKENQCKILLSQFTRSTDNGLLTEKDFYTSSQLPLIQENSLNLTEASGADFSDIDYMSLCNNSRASAANFTTFSGTLGTRANVLDDVKNLDFKFKCSEHTFSSGSSKTLWENNTSLRYNYTVCNTTLGAGNVGEAHGSNYGIVLAAIFPLIGFILLLLYLFIKYRKKARMCHSCDLWRFRGTESNVYSIFNDRSGDAGGIELLCHSYNGHDDKEIPCNLYINKGYSIDDERFNGDVLVDAEQPSDDKNHSLPGSRFGGCNATACVGSKILEVSTL